MTPVRSIPRLVVEAEVGGFRLLWWLQDHAHSPGLASSWETSRGWVVLMGSPAITAFGGSRIPLEATARFGIHAPDEEPQDSAEAALLLIEALRELPDSEALFSGSLSVTVRRGS